MPQPALCCVNSLFWRPFDRWFFVVMGSGASKGATVQGRAAVGQAPIGAPQHAPSAVRLVFAAGDAPLAELVARALRGGGIDIAPLSAGASPRRFRRGELTVLGRRPRAAERVPFAGLARFGGAGGRQGVQEGPCQLVARAPFVKMWFLLPRPACKRPRAASTCLASACTLVYPWLPGCASWCGRRGG